MFNKTDENMNKINEKSGSSIDTGYVCCAENN